METEARLSVSWEVWGVGFLQGSWRSGAGCSGAHNSGDYRSFLRRDVEVAPHDMRIGQRFDQVSWLGRREAFGRPALPRGRAGGVTPEDERVLWRPTRSFAPACRHPRDGPAEAPDRRPQIAGTLAFFSGHFRRFFERFQTFAGRFRMFFSRF